MPAAPSLLIVPYRFKTGKLYTQIASTSAGLVLASSGDFNVTRATTATRFNSAGLIESVASGVPRLDYYTSGGTAGCPALLVEPSAANGILNSQDTATSWTLGANLTSGYVDVIGVSGNNLTVAASGSSIGFAAGRHQRASNNVALASGSTYTISFLMRQTGAHTIGAYYTIISGQDLSSYFDVSGSFSSGSIYNPGNATNRIRRVERFGTNVYRCSETFTMTASGTLAAFNFAPTTIVGGDNPAVGLGIAFAAPQIELGAIPTSFIPTTAAPVTRNAEAINVTGAVSGCIGQTDGTVYLEMQADAAGTGQNFLYVGNNVNDSIVIGKSGANCLFELKVSGTQLIGTNVGLSGTVIKGAIAYANGNYAAYANGNLLASGTTSRTPANALTAIAFSSFVNLPTINAPTVIMRVRAVALYTTRLTNAELATLTTL
jgi:hypothetical protein